MKASRTQAHPLAHLDADRRERLLALPGNEVWRQQFVAPAPVKVGGREVLVTVRRDGDVFTIIAKGLRLVNPTNAHDGWRRESGRARAQRGLLYRVDRDKHTRKLLPPVGHLVGVIPPEPPLVVTITRGGPKRLDNDNATASAKHVRDAIATWLDVDDGDDRVRYLPVVQERGSYVVTVVVQPGGAGG